MNREIQMNLQHILNYLHDDEEKHWIEEGKPAKHIFRDILKVGSWLEDYTPTPDWDTGLFP